MELNNDITNKLYKIINLNYKHIEQMNLDCNKLINTFNNNINDNINISSNDNDYNHNQNNFTNDFNDQEISILTLRNKALALYNNCILTIISLKLQNKTIENHPVIFESIKLRVLLEKINPLILKITPMIKKKIKSFGEKNNEKNLQNFGNFNKNLEKNLGESLDVINLDKELNKTTDPLSLKPNPFNLVTNKNINNNDNNNGVNGVNKVNELKSKNFGNNKEKNKNNLKMKNERLNSDDNGDNIYKVKKKESVPYPYEKEEGSKKKRAAKERERKRLIQTGIIETLREDIKNASSQKPEKRLTKLKNFNRQRMKEIEKIMEKEQYEMDNFIRLPETKKERQKKKELLNVVNMDIENEIMNNSKDFDRLTKWDNNGSNDKVVKNGKFSKRKKVKKKGKKREKKKV